jgi:hypothetical protein
LQCVLAARILTVDFVVCTLAVKEKSGQVSICRIGPFPCELSASPSRDSNINTIIDINILISWKPIRISCHRRPSNLHNAKVTIISNTNIANFREIGAIQWSKYKNKKSWEEIITHFPFIRHGSRRRRKNDGGDTQTHRQVGILISLLDTLRTAQKTKKLETDTQTMGWSHTHPNKIQRGWGYTERGTDTETDRQQGDLIRPILFKGGGERKRNTFNSLYVFHSVLALVLYD